MNRPEVSVVMGVYNGAELLNKTIQSVLSQSDIDFEFIIVNDGSTDSSIEILSSIEKNHSSVIVINQEQQGLTKALINGCANARGVFIARQDNGDISAPLRLKAQIKYLSENPNVSMVSCATKFIGPMGEELHTVIQSKVDAEQGLRTGDSLTLKGPPHHGSVMFRREIYERVGGYRAEFKVAQDIDLWSRLIEHGAHHSLKSVLYEAIVAKNSISMLRRDQQMEATQVIVSCAAARKESGNDSAVLNSYVNRVKQEKKALNKNETDSAYYYFLGSNLANSNRKASSRYLRLATQNKPLHWKAWVKRAINHLKSIGSIN